MNNNFDIDLTELQKVLTRLVNQRVNSLTQDIKSWKQVTNFIYSSINEELEAAKETKAELEATNFTLNALEAEGYVRGLLRAKITIEEWIDQSGLQLDV
jgi:hypothetical protein